MSNPTDAARLDGILEFLRATERLKVTTRSAYTSNGQPESVAEHSWRVCVMALVLREEFPEVDLARLLAMCVVHDLGEAIGGDVPAPEQARRLAADPAATKSAQEREDLLTLLAPLPPTVQSTITGLWDEYEGASSAEARVAKALDKLETILQHTQGDNPPDFDYRFNLGYGRAFTAGHPAIVRLREILDRETARLAANKESSVSLLALGTFDVKVTPQSTDAATDGTTLGRLTLDKHYHGDLDGPSKGEMLSAGTPVKGSAGYVAIERVTGTLNSRRGSFVLQHQGTMSRGAQHLAISVVPDSGTGELEGLTGAMRIIIAPDGKHSYEFDYTLA
jgi:putative hydrolases of HD superfamily